MAFMVPYYTNEPFIEVTNKHGEITLLPADCEHYAIAEDDEVTARYDGKWFGHLSADGYMDQTDWSGPYETEDAARAALSEEYDVDPDTGDDLEEDEE